MDGGVEQPLPPVLGVLAVARILGDVGDQASIENALPIVHGIKTAIEVQVGASEVQPDLLGHLLQGVQALRQQHHIGFIDGSNRQGSQDIAVVVYDRDNLLALLVLVARVANAIAPFLATVLVPSPWSTLVSRCFSAARWATRAMHACHSDPSAARFVKTV